MLSREIAAIRAEMGPCGQQAAAEFANVLVNSAPPPRELEPAIFVRQVVTLLAGYPYKACEHVVLEYPRKNATCSIKRVCEALDSAKGEMANQIAARQTQLRRQNETPEPEVEWTQGDADACKQILEDYLRGFRDRHPAKPQAEPRKPTDKAFAQRRKASNLFGKAIRAMETRHG